MTSRDHEQSRPVWEAVDLPKNVSQALQSIGAVTKVQAIEVVEAWIAGKLPTPKGIDEAGLTVSIELLRPDDQHDSAEDDDVEATLLAESHRMGVLPPEDLDATGRDLVHRHQLSQPLSEPDVTPKQSEDSSTATTPKDPK